METLNLICLETKQKKLEQDKNSTTIVLLVL